MTIYYYVLIDQTASACRDINKVNKDQEEVLASFSRR